MLFSDFVQQLKNQSLEDVIASYNEGKYESNDDVFVECYDKNTCYLDDGLNEFLYKLGAEVQCRNEEFVFIHASDKKWYKVPYRDFPNRFDDSAGDETALFFDKIEETVI